MDLLAQFAPAQASTPWGQIVLGVFAALAALALVALAVFTVVAVAGSVSRTLLINRYLRRKLLPLFAALAVTLCTAMVIIVISVMGGFLEMMRHAVRSTTGDVVVPSDLNGFGPAGTILDAIRALPEVEAATPIIKSYGLLNIQGQLKTVEIYGVEPESFDAVLRRAAPDGKATGFADTLQWTTEHLLREFDQLRPAGSSMTPDEREYRAERRASIERRDLRQESMSFQPPPNRPDLPGIIPGIAVSPSSMRDAEGKYGFANSAVGQKVSLVMLRTTRDGTPKDAARQDFTVVNEFKSGLYDIDANRVYVPYTLLQTKLGMDEYLIDDEEDPRHGQTEPARLNQIMVRGRPGVPIEAVRASVEDELRRFVNAGEKTGVIALPETWRDQHAMFLGAVEKEKGLLTALFAFISLVAVVMIFVIFYSIVLEKTRDIGVLRALGASRKGVASIFLGYGMAIGVLGAALGLALAATVVWNINGLQDLLSAWFGLKIWDEQIYYFDEIPSQMDGTEVTVIAAAAVLSSLVGSLIPAYLAARLDPVEALRYE